MFKILKKSFDTGLATTNYPAEPARLSPNFRGAPRFNFAAWRDPRAAADVCPTEAVTVHDDGATRRVTVDYGLCMFCGECSEADPGGGVTITHHFELAVRHRSSLVVTAEYELDADARQGALKSLQASDL